MRLEGKEKNKNEDRVGRRASNVNRTFANADLMSCCGSRTVTSPSS